MNESKKLLYGIIGLLAAIIVLLIIVVIGMRPGRGVIHMTCGAINTITGAGFGSVLPNGDVSDYVSAGDTPVSSSVSAGTSSSAYQGSAPAGPVTDGSDHVSAAQSLRDEQHSYATDPVTGIRYPSDMGYKRADIRYQTPSMQIQGIPGEVVGSILQKGGSEITLGGRQSECGGAIVNQLGDGAACVYPPNSNSNYGVTISWTPDDEASKIAQLIMWANEK